VTARDGSSWRPVPTPRGVPRQQRALDTRLRLVEATLAAAERTTAPFSLNSICDEAGVTAAGALHHYPSKDHLVLASAAEAERGRIGTASQRRALWREVVRIAFDSRSKARPEAEDLLNDGYAAEIVRGAFSDPPAG